MCNGGRCPAAPYRSVRAVLPHTALRHRSPSGMRSPVAHRSGEAVNPEVGGPPVVEPAGPSASRDPVFDAGQEGQPFVHIAVDGVELPRRVPVAEVRPPPPEHGVEVLDDSFERPARPLPGRALADLGPDRAHGPLRRPLLEEVTTLALPGLPLAVVEAQEVEAFRPSGQVD